MNRMITILGPTASGKTPVAAHLAAKIGGEIISADSRQVYRRMDIGTGKDLADYGEVPYNGNGECEFVFTNTGNEPLIVQKPKSSCGCTVPSWPREPILPGESDSIKVTYKTNRVGAINKSITVTSNALVNSTVVLRIKGRVLEQAPEAMPEKEAVGAPVNN